LAPARLVNPEWPLDLQPRPSVEIGFRHVAHCQALAFLNLGFMGRDNRGNGLNYAFRHIICQLIVFEA